MSEIEEYYQNDDNCLEEIRMARKTFTNAKTTEDQYEAMEKCLGLMYLHAKERIADMAIATLQEASQRKFYFILRWSQT